MGAESGIEWNPAMIIRKRFFEKEIEHLLEMQWWNWTEKQLESAMDLLYSQDIERL